MIQKLDLNENLINKINYSLSFSLNNEILSVERVSYEPLWRKIVFTGLFVIPTTCFLLTTLYCIYAIIVDAQYANHYSEALPFLILITLICLTAIPSINSLYSSKSSLDNSQYSFMSFFVSKKKFNWKIESPFLLSKYTILWLEEFWKVKLEYQEKESYYLGIFTFFYFRK